ncbi:4'-phosphopantetheinyl transferase superfamily protein [Streptomyces sp. 21So2-11]|uniref:4'-phosphopantetheinyl transferase family protein n=1 Tax=Streptomyces sp. 21So2-11 TaxID=3144408 RepID=UPI00321B81D6
MRAANGLDVWLLRLPKHDQIAHLLDRSELDDRELERGAGFLRPRDSVLYLSAHIVLRRILGDYLGLRPRDVRFVREPCPGCGEPHGRPAVADPARPLHFSLSHGSGVALVAVAPATVGVDVERTPHSDTVEMCSPALHPGERAELAAVAPDARCEAFGRVWTRKEAYLKGLGTGLSREPSLDYLGVETEHWPPGWTVLDIPVGPRHHGAVALRGNVSEPVAVHRLPVDVLFDGAAVPPGNRGGTVSDAAQIVKETGLAAAAR